MFESLLALLSIAAEEGEELSVVVLEGLLVGLEREDVINVAQVLGLERNADGKTGEGVWKRAVRRGCEFEQAKCQQSSVGGFEDVHVDYYYI